jgi:hypothetical protein
MRESVKRPALSDKILRTLIFCAFANILSVTAVTECGFSNGEAGFPTTISFVGLLASSNSVSGRSAFGTITSAMVKTR